MELTLTRPGSTADENSIPRSHERSAYKASVMIAEDNTEYYHRATMYNYSETGMYFESDHDPKPGSGINILMENYSPAASGPETSMGYRAKVVWTKEILDDYTFYYGVGVEISGPLT